MDTQPLSLSLAPETTQTEWIEIAKSIAQSSHSQSWQASDLIKFGVETYGKNVAYDLAEQATGWCRRYLYRIESIAKRFPPEKRLPGLSFFHYQSLKPFPSEVTDRLLAEAAAKGLPARATYKLACEAVGKEPRNKKRFKARKVIVQLWDELYDKLVERAGTGRNLSAFISQILEEHILGEPIERQPTNGSKTAAWRKKVKSALEKPARRKVKIQMTANCYGRNTNFKDAAVAKAAAAQYSVEHGYRVESGWCENCKAFHVRQLGFASSVTLRALAPIAEAVTVA